MVKNKLLGFLKNLIICIVLVFMISLIFTSTSFAAYKFADKMKESISGWYISIRNVCLAAFPIMAIVMGFNILKSPDRKAAMKEGLPKWIIGIVLVSLLHVIMILILSINGLGINEAKRVGTELSGIDLTGEYYATRTSNDEGTEGKEITYIDPNGNVKKTKVKNTGQRQNEFSMYEEAVSKAYDVKFSSGFIGMCMYVLLTIYTYKFFFVYLKRFVNVITLTLIGPILITLSTKQKIFNGSDNGMRKKWFKEYIYNVLIQSLHAIYYATLIGLSFKFSQSAETYIGSLLTLLLFAFVFKIDEIIRKLFNVVGGSTSIKVFNTAGAVGTILGGGGSASQGGDAQSLGETFKGGVAQFGQDIKGEAIGIGQNYAASIKQKAVNIKQLPKDVERALSGEQVKVTAAEIAQQEKVLAENKGFERIRGGIAFAFNKGITGIDMLTFDLPQNIKNAVQKKYNQVINDYNDRILELNHNVRVLENTKQMLRVFRTHEMPVMAVTPDYQDMYRAAVDTSPELQALVADMKDSIEAGSSDLVSLIYDKVGPQAFLYKKVGSPVEGLALLAESIYGDQVVQAIQDALYGIERSTKGVLKADKMIGAADKASGTIINTVGKAVNAIDNLPETIDTAKKKVIAFPTTAVNKIRETKENVVTGTKKQVVKTVYKFERFSAKATQRIVGVAMKHYIMAEPYLKVISNVKSKIDAGVLTVRGSVNPQKTQIKYTGKVKARKTTQSNAALKIVNFQQRRQNGEWAKAIAKSMDKHDAMRRQRRMVTQNANARPTTLDVRIAQVQALTAGQVRMATMIENGSLVSLENGNHLMKNTTPTSVIYSSIQDNIVTKSEIVDAIIQANGADGVIYQSIFGEDKETAVVNLIPKELLEEHPELAMFQQVGIVKENTIIQFVINENGEAVQQILSLDGQIIQPALNEDGSPIQFMQVVNENGEIQSQQIIQRILNMDGQIVEQIINLDQNVVIPQEEYQVQEISIMTENVLEQIRNITYDEIANNLMSINDKMQGLEDVVAVTMYVNDIANPAAPENPYYGFMLQQQPEFESFAILETQMNQIQNILFAPANSDTVPQTPEQRLEQIQVLINNINTTEFASPELTEKVQMIQSILAPSNEGEAIAQLPAEERLAQVQSLVSEITTQVFPSIMPEQYEQTKTIMESFVVVESKVYQIQNILYAPVNADAVLQTPEEKLTQIQMLVNSLNTEEITNPVLAEKIELIKNVLTPPNNGDESTQISVEEKLEHVQNIVLEITTQIFPAMEPEQIEPPKTVAEAYAILESKIHQIQNVLYIPTVEDNAPLETKLNQIQSIILNPNTDDFSSTVLGKKVQQIQDVITPPPNDNGVNIEIPVEEKMHQIQEIISETTEHVLSQITPENVIFTDEIADASRVVSQATTVEDKVQALESVVQDIPVEEHFDELLKGVQYQQLFEDLKAEADKQDEADMVLVEVSKELGHEAKYLDVNDDVTRQMMTDSLINNGFVDESDESSLDDALSKMESRIASVPNDFTADRVAEEIFRKEAMGEDATDSRELLNDLISQGKDPLMAGVESLERRVAEIGDKIAESTTNVTEATKEKVSDAADFVSGKVSDAVDYVSEKANDVADYVSEKVNDAAEFVAENGVIGTAFEVSDKIDEGIEKLNEKIDDIAETVHNAKEEMKEKKAPKKIEKELKKERENRGVDKDGWQGEDTVVLIFKLNVEGGYQRVMGTNRMSFDDFLEKAKPLDNSDIRRVRRDFADRTKRELGIGNYTSNKKVLTTMNYWDFEVYPIANSDAEQIEETSSQDAGQEKEKEKAQDNKLNKDEISLQRRLEPYVSRIKDSTLEFFRLHDIKDYKEGKSFSNLRKWRDYIVRGGFLESRSITKANIEYLLKHLELFSDFGKPFIDSLEKDYFERHEADNKIASQKKKYKEISTSEVNRAVEDDVKSKDKKIIDLERARLTRKTVVEATGEGLTEENDTNENPEEGDIVTPTAGTEAVLEAFQAFNQNKIAVETNRFKREQLEAQGRVAKIIEFPDLGKITYRDAS